MREVICVLGMHRSGSSLVAQILYQNGVDLGPRVVGASEFNRDGHFEDRFVLRLNKRLLIHFGGSWDRPPTLPPEWLEDQTVQEFLDEGRAYAASLETPTGRFLFKEPRSCLLLPFWRRIFGEMSYVVVLRNPESVVASIVARNREWRRWTRLGWRLRRTLGNWWVGEHEPLREIDEARARALWHRYYGEVIRGTEGCRVIAVTYERILSAPETEVPRLVRSLIPGVGTVELGAVKPALNHGRDLEESKEVSDTLRRTGTWT